jgi:hypothetical protein
MSIIYRHLLRLLLAAVVGAMLLTLLPTRSVKAEAPAVNVFELLHKQGNTTLKSGQPYNVTDHLTITVNARLDNGNGVNLEIVKHSARSTTTPPRTTLVTTHSSRRGKTAPLTSCSADPSILPKAGPLITIRNAGSAGWNSA